MFKFSFQHFSKRKIKIGLNLNFVKNYVHINQKYNFISFNIGTHLHSVTLYTFHVV